MENKFQGKYKLKLKLTFTKKLALGLAVLSIVGLITIFIIVNTMVHDIIYGNVIDIAQRDVLLYAHEIEHKFITAGQTISSLATALSSLPSEEHFEAIAQNFTEEYYFIENTFIGFNDGSVINGIGWTPTNAGEELEGIGWGPWEGWASTERPWFVAALAAGEGNIAITEPYFSMSMGTVTVAMSTWMPQLGGVGAVVGFSLSLEYTLSMVAQLDTILDGYLILTDTQGEIIFHPNPRYNPNADGFVNILDIPFGECLMSIITFESEGIRFDDYRLGPSYFVASPVEVVGWTLVAVIPVEATQSLVSQNLAVIMTALALVLIVLFVFTMIVVSYLSRSMEESRTSEERLRDIFENMPLATNIWDLDLNLLGCNEAAPQMFGMRDKHEYIKRFHELSPQFQPDGSSSVEKAKALLQDTYKNGRNNYEWISQTLDGEQIPCEITTIRVQRRDGYQLLAFVRDMRDFYKNQENIEKEREVGERIQLMFDATPLIIEFWDENYNCIDCNQTAINFYGFSSKEEYREKLHEYPLDYQPDGSSLWEKWNKHLSDILTNGSDSFEIALQRRNLDIVYLEVNGIRMKSGDDIFVITYSLDVTQLRKLQREKQHIEVVEESNKAKSRFLARMSHEIRTPITAILGISEIELRNPDLSPHMGEAFAKIHSSSSILLGIINDILDLSKIEAEKMKLLYEVYEASSLISDVIHLHLANFAAKNITFSMHVDENLPKFLIGDPLRIGQIMHNLLSNAFKYTESGLVELSFKGQTDSTKDNHMVLVVSIRDTGLGMTQEQLGALCNNEFTRFHESKNRSIGGTGLGMSIVYSLAQLMDAQIDIQSEVGMGTNVVVSIPQKIAGPTVLGKEAALRLQQFDAGEDIAAKKFKFELEPMPYGSVLIVDDVDANLYVARGLLAFYDLRIDTCVSGYEAINKIKEGNVYDIVFMDQMMPGINGSETMQAMRDMGYTHPIVALTANALIGQAEELINSGFDGFVSKPIQTKHLNTILIRYIKDKQPAAVIEAARAAKAGSMSAAQMNIEDYQSNTGLVNKLRLEFASTRKNIIFDIKQALNKGDTETAHRLAHTLKGLAGLIHEATLAEAAGQVEDLLAENELPTNEDLSALQSELSRVLEDIGKPEPKELSIGKVLDKNMAIATLDKLSPMLQARDAGCLNLLDELRAIPETAVLVKLIEQYDFPLALKTLTTLRAILEELKQNT